MNVVHQATASAVQGQSASADALVINTWLRSHTRNTRTAYQGDIARFVNTVGKPLREITATDLQDYADQLRQDDGREYAPSSKARMLWAVKSLLSFCRRQGYLQFDIGEVVRVPSVPNDLAERILPESAMLKMIHTEANQRNQTLLQVLYVSGARVSEITTLRWRDVAQNGDAGQLTLHGKGGKDRVVLLSADTWSRLVALRQNAGGDAPVFQSRKGGHLTTRQVARIVKDAANRAGLENAGDVSPHWFRHAHASHALDRGAPVHLVQQTLGHASLTTTSKYSHARPGDSSGRYLPV
jgi:integrase/recombinase XerD